jgi:hypothetical protein
MKIVSVLLSSFVITSAVASMIGGCSKEASEPPMTPANAPNSAARTAGEQLATARCDHEQRCNEIGWDKEFPSREQCMTVNRDYAAKKVNKCQVGIDQKDLSHCLNAVANQDCGGVGGAFESIGKGIDCNMDDLCLDN